ncbi:Asp-tRNA(Asn)/Glu-tRNA(Gln) amidotransferase A subunit family amidase [Kribbella antiqua]|uniref:Asp-tRNA(Asn)/Glu-tRNA(Gln) amidotransferase A subunit family amidase n=1 Tax=Kribbella antiqua TaxID=2512217 RepID=A0A4R2I828_9ACTN|nr:amidase [Kribbella antiqua]TCO40494.1 Asp-tRNA(Asn)/Glu-tRNA(Gln) amidotransferase A subunit family amidase [Kribbella antiqua]
MNSLLQAFMRYERALLANDVPVLDELFAEGSETLRADGGAVLVGHEHIAAFRAGRPGVPPRTLERVHLRELTPDAVVLMAETSRPDGTTGIQTQLWQRLPKGWVVTVAHVSTAPPARPVELPIDPVAWRIAPGDKPLVEGAEGPLSNLRVAVKDLFAVAGQRIGAGNPAWLAEASVESAHAGAVAALLNAGADVVGIAQTDELAFSLAGTNIHYGTPLNPAAPGRITGGSSSGSAAAVAAGHADLGLGTDTAGSIRVPASYCGLYGLRTTHDVVDRSGLVALAPSFDAVGLLARTGAVLAAGAEVLLPAAEVMPARELLVAPTLMELAAPDTRLAVEAALRALMLRLDLPVREVDVDRAALEEWFLAFRKVQSAEAWRIHGEFVAAHPGEFEPAVEARFRSGAEVSDVEAARSILAEARSQLRELLPPGVVLALPSSASPAPPVDADAATIDTIRAGTLRLTCLASLAGLPALSIPTARVGTLPAGLCLVGGPEADRSLLALID